VKLAAFPFVMAGQNAKRGFAYDPAIHVFAAVKTWMPGTKPGHDAPWKPVSIGCSFGQPLKMRSPARARWKHDDPRHARSTGSPP
jgi:hypothetical protein